MIEIFHISTNEIIVNDFTKTLLSNKFKKFVELIRISKIKFNNNKLSNSRGNPREPDLLPRRDRGRRD